MTPHAAPRLARPLVAMVTDRTRYRASDEDRAMQHVVEDVRRAARAGVNLIQVRERAVSDRALLLHAREVVAAVEGTAARVLVNARADVTLAARADGVHLPASSPAASRLRALLPPEFLLGRSVHDLAEALAAERDGGCDYLIFGTIYPTSSKPANHSVAGVDALARVCAAVRLPVLAIGGIGPDRLPEVAAAGAAGVAAIGMFVSGVDGEGPDVGEFVAHVRELLGAGRDTSGQPGGPATESLHRS